MRWQLGVKKDAVEMLGSLGFRGEDELAKNVAYIDWAADMPHFPIRVKWALLRYLKEK